MTATQNDYRPEIGVFEAKQVYISGSLVITPLAPIAKYRLKRYA